MILANHTKVQRVLLSTDFSENADHAIHYALSLFDKEGVEFCLLNSYSLIKNFPDTLISLEDVLHEQSEKRLANTTKRLRSTFNLPKIKSLSISGNPPAAIHKVADELQVDVVVLGAKGDTFNSAIYGSTTSRLIRRMNRPLLVVPINYEVTVPKNIVLATDLVQIEDLRILDTMLYIARKFNAEVTILNVTGGASVEQVQQAIHRLDFNNHFDGIRSGFEVVDNDDVVAGIIQYTNKRNADLLVMFPKQYSCFTNIFRKSVSRNVLKHTSIPVMVI